MSTVASVAEALAVSGFVLLAVSGLRHLRWQDAFVVQLTAQQRWRSPSAVATGVTALELVVAATGVGASAAGADGAVLAAPLVALAVLGLAFTGFQLVLRAQTPDAPCGCDPTRAGPVGVGSLVKAAWPALCGTVGLVAAGPLDDVLPAVAGLALAVVVDRLPQG